MKGMIVTILLASIRLIGCRQDCDVSILQTPNNMPVFNLKTSSGAEDGGVEITLVQVARIISQDKPVELVWVFETTDFSKPIRVRSITYGVIPPGFQEGLKAKPLIVGETYEVMVSRPGMIGGARFKFEK